MECRSADIDNVEGWKGNDCRLKKWYCEWRRDEMHGGRIGDL